MILINSSARDSLKIFQPFARVNIPIGSGFILAVAEQKGINIKFIDERIEKNIIDLAAKYVKELEPPYIFGFSVITIAYESALIAAKKLKDTYPNSIVCFGGIHATACVKEILANEFIDCVFSGEIESTFPEFYKSLKEGIDFARIKNISFRRNGIIINNSRAGIIEDLDSLPPFPYHKFSPKHYDMGTILSSRGCPYDCIFCSNRIATGKKYRFRSAQSIVSDIELLYKKFGIRHIIFFDDNFVVNKARLYTLLEMIKSSGLNKNVQFHFQARGDNVDYTLLKELYSAGFKYIFFGIETATEHLMKIVNKSTTVKEYEDAIRLAKKIGFHVSGTFIFGLPGETKKDRMLCLKMSKELGLDIVRFNNATPYPGTELYEIAKKDKRLNIQGQYKNFISVSTFIENPFRKMPITYVPEGNYEDEIRNDILLSYFSFYFNWEKIKNTIYRPDVGVEWQGRQKKISDNIKNVFAIVTLGILIGVKFFLLFVDIFFKKRCKISSEVFVRTIRDFFKSHGQGL